MKAKIWMVPVLCLAATGCAVKQMEPVEFTCKAARSWQNTGVMVHAGDHLSVLYENGQWTADVRSGMASPAGNPLTPGRPGDVLPAASHSALIGRVGDSVFLLGNKFDGVVPAEGRLYCVINTDISASDNAPFLLTDGSVTMRAAIVRANPVCTPGSMPIPGVCL